MSEEKRAVPMEQRRGSDPADEDHTHMRAPVNYLQAAIDTGQLVYRDDVLDDDEGSPTYDKYVSVFHGTETVEGRAFDAASRASRDASVSALAHELAAEALTNRLKEALGALWACHHNGCHCPGSGCVLDQALSVKLLDDPGPPDPQNARARKGTP